MIKIYHIKYRYLGTQGNQYYTKYVDSLELRQYERLYPVVEIIETRLLDSDEVKKLSWSRRDMRNKGLLGEPTYSSLGYV